MEEMALAFLRPFPPASGEMGVSVRSAAKQWFQIYLEGRKHMKNNSKRILALLAALALTLGLLTGCGQKPQEQPAAEPAVAETETPEAEAPAESEAPADAEAPAEDEAPAESDPEAVKHITLTVTYADETSEEYTIDTTAEFLKEAIEGEVELGGSESEYGFFLESVNGVTADYDADGAYWAIYVNDEYGMYGLDTQPVTDGDSYALVYTVG